MSHFFLPYSCREKKFSTVIPESVGNLLSFLRVYRENVKLYRNKASENALNLSCLTLK